MTHCVNTGLLVSLIWYLDEICCQQRKLLFLLSGQCPLRRVSAEIFLFFSFLFLLLLLLSRGVGVNRPSKKHVVGLVRYVCGGGVRDNEGVERKEKEKKKKKKISKHPALWSAATKTCVWLRWMDGVSASKLVLTFANCHILPENLIYISIWGGGACVGWPFKTLPGSYCYFAIWGAIYGGEDGVQYTGKIYGIIYNARTILFFHLFILFYFIPPPTHHPITYVSTTKDDRSPKVFSWH